MSVIVRYLAWTWSTEKVRSSPWHDPQDSPNGAVLTQAWAAASTELWHAKQEAAAGSMGVYQSRSVGTDWVPSGSGTE